MRNGHEGNGVANGGPFHIEETHRNVATDPMEGKEMPARGGMVGAMDRGIKNASLHS